MGSGHSRPQEYSVKESDRFFGSKKDSHQVYYRFWKSEKTAPRALVLACHGLGEHCNRYETLFSAFAEKGFPVVSLDYRGHGKTFYRNAKTKAALPKGHTLGILEFLVSDLEQLLEMVPELDPEFNSDLPLFVFGHSLGGLVALSLIQVATLKNLKGAIISAPALEPYHINSATYYAVKFASRLAPRYQDSNQLDLKALSPDPKVLEDYVADPLVHDRLTLGTAWDILERGKQVMHDAEKFSAIPMVLAHGTADRITSYDATRRFYELLKGSQSKEFWEFAGKYHELHNELYPFRQELAVKYVDWFNKQLKRQGLSDDAVKRPESKL